MDPFEAVGARIERLFGQDLLTVPAGYGDYIARIRAHRAQEGKQFWIGSEHPGYAYFLDRLVQALAPQRVLELGVQCGGSAYGLTLHLPDDAFFVGIDSEYEPAAQGGMAAFAAMFGRPNIQFHPGYAADVLAQFHEPWDLVHLDHAKDCYLSDLERMAGWGQLRPHTVVVIHDTKTWACDYVEPITARFARYRDLEMTDARLLWGFQELPVP